MLRYVKNGMLLLSVAYIVIGMLLLIMPETSLLWICNIFGVVVLVTGIVCLIQYARIRGTGFTAPFMLLGKLDAGLQRRVDEGAQHVGALTQDVVTAAAQNDAGALGGQLLDDVALQNVDLVGQGHRVAHHVQAVD